MRKQLLTILILLFFISSGCGSTGGSDSTPQSNDQKSTTDNVTSNNITPKANAGADKSVNEGSLVILDGTGSSDPNGDALTYSWVQTAGLSVILNNATTVNPTFTSPTVYTQQVLTFQLTVNDGSLQNTDEVNVVVNNTVNEPPAANAGTDQVVAEGMLVTLNGSTSSDPNGDTLIYSWIQTAGPSVIFTNSSTATPNFTSPLVYNKQALFFQLTVSDGKLQSTDTITVTVNNTINDIPTANAGPDKTSETGSVVILSGSASDPNGDTLTYQWSLKSIPSGSSAQLISTDTTFPSFIPDIEGDYIVQLIVNDGKDNSIPDEVKITAVKPKRITLKGPINTKIVYGKVHYLGQLINETDNPSCFIEITIDSMDDQNNLIDTDFTYVDGSTMVVSDIIYTDTCLRPGEVGGFEIYTDLTQVPPKFDYVINYSSSKVSEPAVLPSQVIIDGQITETTDYFGDMKLMGFIKNLHPSITLKFVEISFVALNGDKVIDTEFAYINGSTCVLSYGGTTDTCLAPGESRSFSATLDASPSEVTEYYYKINYNVVK